MLPLAKPIITSLMFLAFLVGWNDFLFSNMLTTGEGPRTASVIIYVSAVGGERVEWDVLMVMTLMAGIPPVLLYILAQGQFLKTFRRSRLLTGSTGWPKTPAFEYIISARPSSTGVYRRGRNVNLQLAEGALMVLLGPSGCGKTTTLRCIAGLEQPDNDDAIWVKERNITRLQPKDRNLAFVFQDTALFPHLSIRRNISFGLDMHKTYGRAERRRRVDEVAKLLHVEDLLERKPYEVSGGQAQRVALGRAIVMEPDAFLLDEPLANLDAALRVEMRTEIKRLQKRLGISTIFVTHDQEEALSLGDVIAVMKDGEVQQVGTSHDIYHHPGQFLCRQLHRLATAQLPALPCADGQRRPQPRRSGIPVVARDGRRGGGVAGTQGGHAGHPPRAHRHRTRAAGHGCGAGFPHRALG